MVDFDSITPRSTSNCLQSSYKKGLPSSQGRMGVVEKLVDARFQKSVYGPNGISPTVREGHGDVVRVASRFGDKQAGGVYSRDGICPTVSWGKRGPFPHHIFENPSGTKTPHKVSEVGEAKRLYSPKGKSPPIKHHGIRIFQKSPDWRGTGR